jgi:hypothetical protein
MVDTVGVGTAIPPWLAQDAIMVLGVQHDLSKSLKKFLPKFDLDKKEDISKDHINKFMLSLHLMNVQHEDVLC